MKTIAKRLADGQDLLAEIKQLLKEHGVTAGVILSGVGGLKQSKIRAPVINDDARYIRPKYVEINSLHGTVSQHGCHVHISVSDHDGKTWGGHVKEGCVVWMTCELVVGVLDDVTFKREPDPQTGFDELVVSNGTHS